MTQVKQALLAYFRGNLALYIITVLLFLLGIALGVFSVGILPEPEIRELQEYLDLFVYGFHSEAYLDPLTVVRNSLSQNLKLLLLLWLLGVTMLGIPAAAFILSLKGFTLGFTVTFIFHYLSFSGLTFAMGAVVPQNLLIVPALLTGGVACLSFSLLQIRGKVKKKKFNFWLNFFNYTALFAVLVVVILAGSLVEGYISTVFIRLSVGIL